MTVDSWDPSSGSELKPLDLERFCRAAAELEAEQFGLSDHEIARLAPFSRHQGSINWSQLAADLDSDAVVGLIRLFTLAEGMFPAWEAGARSPVVPLVALLKARDAYPPDLTRWIKANTSNRFLPHGSLMDRL
jgi:hypothetical protein